MDEKIKGMRSSSKSVIGLWGETPEEVHRGALGCAEEVHRIPYFFLKYK